MAHFLLKQPFPGLGLMLEIFFLDVFSRLTVIFRRQANSFREQATIFQTPKYLEYVKQLPRIKIEAMAKNK